MSRRFLEMSWRRSCCGLDLDPDRQHCYFVPGQHICHILHVPSQLLVLFSPSFQLSVPQERSLSFVRIARNAVCCSQHLDSGFEYQ